MVRRPERRRPVTKPEKPIHLTKGTLAYLLQGLKNQIKAELGDSTNINYEGLNFAVIEDGEGFPFDAEENTIYFKREDEFSDYDMWLYIPRPGVMTSWVKVPSNGQEMFLLLAELREEGTIIIGSQGPVFSLADDAPDPEKITLWYPEIKK